MKKNIILAMKVSVIIGILLNLINNSEIIFSLNFTMPHCIKIIFTFLVPFIVSLYTSNKITNSTTH